MNSDGPDMFALARSRCHELGFCLSGSLLLRIIGHVCAQDHELVSISQLSTDSFSFLERMTRLSSSIRLAEDGISDQEVQSVTI